MYVLVSGVHAVLILSAVFCIICSLLMFVVDASGDHIAEAYSIIGIAMALYVMMIVSFVFYMVSGVSSLSIWIVLHAFVAVLSSLGSKVSPSILGSISGVKRVHVVLSALRMRLFVCVYVCISCRCD